MNSHHVFRWLFALSLVCASITQSKAIAQTKCSENQFQASEGMKQMKRAIRSGDVAKIKGLFDQANLVNILLLASADANIKNNSGETAMMYAAQWGNVEMMRALLSSGARLTDQSSDGRTPLMYARREGVIVLIGAGADINATDKMGYTALMWAVIESETDKIEKLLRSGADVNVKAKDGHTALSLVKKNYIENSPMEQLLRLFGAIE